MHESLIVICQGLITDATSPVPNYHSFDVVHEEAGHPSEAVDLDVQETTDTDQELCQQESQSDKTRSRGVAPILFQLIANQSYILTLIIMMVSSYCNSFGLIDTL